MQTQRFLNVTGMAFTPAGGPPVPIGGVTMVVINPRARAEASFVDGDLYPSAKAVASADPLVRVTAPDPGAFDAVPVGVKGVLTFVNDDQRAGATPGGGGRRVTVDVAVCMGPEQTSKFRESSELTLLFETQSVDGRTSPVAVAPA